ncbi:MAG TPA: TolC family protein [Bryobacteraceae bacterium]|nr:TolC family protein [Bryobacteraceae bacterium]
MTLNRTPIRVLGILLVLCASAAAQQELSIQPPTGGWSFLTGPYRPSSVPSIRLQNSSRLASLIRAGNLYLSAHDVVALAIENNIDVEIQRYGPLLAQEVLRRAQAGGGLRSVGLGVVSGPQSVSLQGVSVNPSGGVGISAGAGVSSGGGIVTQLGPPIPSLDPTVFGVVSFGHTTAPQSNVVLTNTPVLVDSTRTLQLQYAQNFDFGLTAQMTYSSLRQSLNSASYNLNPYTSGSLDLILTQNLLQNFGRAVMDRNIRVQKNNVKVSELQFKLQLVTTVSAALNLYWDLVSFDADVRARRREVATAQQLLDDNKKLVKFGTAAPIEITRAESQLYASQQDLVTAQTNLLQQETILKNYLSRNGVADAGLTNVHIIPLEKFEIPATDETRPLDDLIRQAVASRPEMEQARLNLASNQMNLVGIKSSLKPTLQAFAELTNNGLSGDLTELGIIQGGSGPFIGGYGNLLSQIFRRDYPNYSAGISLNIPLRNRAAQADYVTSLLELRQNELNLRKNTNQIRVDVQNALIGLQQARSRYEAAVKARVLQEQTLAGDQKRYALGATVAFQVVQDQRDLATAQSTEVQSMANYTHARIAMDQALGTTLEVNHISINEALQGRVSQPSVLPAEIPAEERQ